MKATSLDNKRALLATHPLLEHLEAHDLDVLVGCSRVQSYPARRVIFRKGDPGKSMMAVISGRVKISSLTPEGKEAVLNIIGPGQIFGEIALLDGKERSADATALEDVDLLVLARRDFVPFIERRPALCLKMLAILCDRLRRTTEQVEDLFLAHSARVARTLRRLAIDYGRQTEEGILIDMKMSQGQFGMQVSMTREALNRLLSAWRREGVISFEGGYFTIHNMARLEELTDGEL